jgi:hypothetical protein
MDGYFCRNNPLDSDSVAFFEQAIASRGRTTAADVAWIERLEAMHRRAVRLCSGLPEGWVRDHSWRYLLQGAQLGDDFLAAMYVIAPPLDRNDFLENPEPWSQYQQHAATLLRRAAEHGELRAIWQLQRIHSGRGALIGMPHAIVPNRRLAAVYAVAFQSPTMANSHPSRPSAATRRMSSRTHPARRRQAHERRPGSADHSRSSRATAPAPTSGVPACACSTRRSRRPTAASARSTGWRSTPARSRTTSSAPGCPKRPCGLPRVPRLDQGPADHADRRRHPLAQRRAAPDARPVRLPAPGALVQGRAFAGQEPGRRSTW